MSVLKPDPTNVTGLSAVDAKIGNNASNPRIYAYSPHIDESLNITFTVMYFWNSAAYQQWKIDGSVLPFYQKFYNFVGVDPDTGPSVRTQCYSFLLAQAPFNGTGVNAWVTSAN